MKKMVSKVIATGVMALLVGAFAPHSSARAQVYDACAPLDNSVTTELTKAQETILCAIGAECKGVDCKEEAYDELSDCLCDAKGVVAVEVCNQEGLAALQKCIAGVTLGEAACEINPTVPGAPAL
jgi:hypothetical protein